MQAWDFHSEIKLETCTPTNIFLSSSAKVTLLLLFLFMGFAICLGPTTGHLSFRALNEFYEFASAIILEDILLALNETDIRRLKALQKRSEWLGNPTGK